MATVVKWGSAVSRSGWGAGVTTPFSRVDVRLAVAQTSTAGCVNEHPLRGRRTVRPVLCWLGLHAWKGLSCDDRRCVRCGIEQHYAYVASGHLMRWVTVATSQKGRVHLQPWRPIATGGFRLWPHTACGTCKGHGYARLQAGRGAFVVTGSHAQAYRRGQFVAEMYIPCQVCLATLRTVA